MHLVAPAPHCAHSEHTTAALPCQHSLATSSERSVTQCVILLNPGLSFRNAAVRHESGILMMVDGLSGWAKAVGGEPRLPKRTSAARLSPDPRWPPPKATCMLASAPPPAPVAFIGSRFLSSLPLILAAQTPSRRQLRAGAASRSYRTSASQSSCSPTLRTAPRAACPRSKT